MLPCEDGHLFFNYLIEGARKPLLLVLELDEPDLPTDEAELGAFLATHTRRRKAKEVFEALALLGATCAIVQDPEQLLTNEHLLERQFFEEVSGPAGVLRFPGPPARMSVTPAARPRRARPFRGWRKRAAQEPGASSGASSGPPLAGVRVLDLTQAWLGPYATMLLADLGAEVIKIESPTRPDVWRGVWPQPPCARPGSHRWNTCHFFNSVNRNKSSLALDLDQERGKELFLKLVETADLVMENYTPRVMDNFGLGYPVLSRVNPALVMVSFSGYGKSGRYRDFKAHGASIETISGWVSLFGYPDSRPMTMGEYQVDPIVGLQMAACALVGLLSSNARGTGQLIEGSMIETAIGYIGEEVLLASSAAGQPTSKGNRHRQMAPHSVFRCYGEDEWVAIAVRNDSEWLALLSVVDQPVLRDRRYSKAEGRLELADEVEAALSDWTRSRLAREIMLQLQAAGVPAGVVQRTDQALVDPHLEERGWFKPMRHPDTGTHKYYGFPWSFSQARLSARLPPPRLGEDSAAILRAEFGLLSDEIQALVEAQVTGAVLEASDGPDMAARRRR